MPDSLSDAVIDIEHVCPRCHARLALPDLQAALPCPSCGRQFRAVQGVISCLIDEPVNPWQSFFEGRSQADDRDTSAANDYRTALQQRYMIEAFHRACGPVANEARLLDAGCGNGLFWAALFGKPNVIGVDYSLGMCLLARARGMRVYHADVSALPFDDGQFDLIYSSEILQCVTMPSPLMAEMARVCRPGGRIVVSTLNRNSILRRAMRQVRRILPDSAAPADTAAIQRSAAELAAIGRGCSLSVRSVWWVHFPLPWLRRTASEHYPLEPMASNMVIEFVKATPPSPNAP